MRQQNGEPALLFFFDRVRPLAVEPLLGFVLRQAPVGMGMTGSSCEAWLDSDAAESLMIDVA